MIPLVSIIILNWNNWRDTLECLESIYQITYTDYNVIIVDNNSQDQSLQKIKDYCNGRIKVQSEFFQYQTWNKPIKLIEYTNQESEKESNQKKNLNPQYRKLFLIENDGNYGFAEGNNIGIRFALKNLKSDYILLLNNDTVVDPEFLNELIVTAESEEKIGFVGPKTYYYDKSNRIQAAGGGNIDFQRGESHEIGFNQEDNGSLDQLMELDYVGGVCLLVKASVIEEIGLMDTNYFMYWEDVDWCFNGREADYKSVYTFKSKIWHKYGASSKNYFKTYYHNRNRLYFVRKHASKTVYHKFLSYYLKEVLIESGYQLIYRRDWPMFKSLFTGTIDGLRI